ncbi:MAG: hypothetical protein ABI083_08485 [Lapillicoccus sp.]
MFIASTVSLASTVSMVPAHGVGSRQDLPLPFTALVIAAALALLVSFVALGALWREPRFTRDDGWAVPQGVQQVLQSRWTRGIASGLAGVLTLWVLASLLFGRDTANNPVPYVIYVWLWVGLPALSLVLGPVWTTLNPMRWLHRGLTRLARIDPDSRLTDARPGLWPAAALLLVFTWLELVAEDRTSLPVLRIAVAFVVLVSVIGSLAFGRSWFRQGDPFEVLSRTYGQLSPLGRRPDGRFLLRTPVHGPSLMGRHRGLLATVSVLLGSTAYDSLSSDIRYAAWVQSTPSPTLLRTATLVATCLVVALALLLAATLASMIAGVPARGMGEEFAPSIIPIAAGYLVAHYWSLFVFQGQRTLALLSDPFGTGADLLGTAGITPGQALIAPTLVAVIQAGAIVIGHVLGIVVAHERAIRIFDRRSSIVGQLPLMALMVLYTVGGLSLLFSS